MTMYGFTSFAKDHLLTPDGFVKDTTARWVFIIGSRKVSGEPLVKTERRTTFRVAFIEYVNVPTATHLWVQWSDGRRRLVHRREEVAA